MKKIATPSQVKIPVEIIQTKIHMIRCQKVMFDKDLAELYGVTTKYLTRQVRRNIERFPGDFMFRLTPGEILASRCQFGTLKRGQNIKYPPYVFTEHGILMLSSVLGSPRAIEVNIQIMRVFVKLKEMLLTHKDLAKRIEALEHDFQSKFKDHDQKIMLIFEAIKQLLLEKQETEKNKMPIGFSVQKSNKNNLRK